MLRLLVFLVGAAALAGCGGGEPLTVTDPSGMVLDTGVEDGLDVFTRQADGSWKIHVSHAFTK